MTDFFIVLLCFLPLIVYIAMQFWIEPKLDPSFIQVTDKDPPTSKMSSTKMNPLTEN